MRGGGECCTLVASSWLGFGEDFNDRNLYCIPILLFLILQSPSILVYIYRVNGLSNAVQLRAQTGTIVAAAAILAPLIGQRSFASVRLRSIPSIFSRSRRRAPWKVNGPWTVALRQALAGIKVAAMALAVHQAM